MSFPSNSRRSSRAAPLPAAFAIFAATGLFLCGCETVRMTSSLGRQTLSETTSGGPYFVVSADGFRNFDAILFNRMLHGRYPSLFAQTPDSFPVMIRVEQGATENSQPFGPFLFGVIPQVLSCGLIGTIWESDRSKLNVAIIVSDGEEPTTSVEVSASRQSHGLLDAAVARLFQRPSDGWHAPRGDLAAEEFEGIVNAIADALASTIARMSPESRDALRRNPVALQRFQKKFPWGFGVQKRGVAERTIHVYPARPDGDGTVPRVVGMSFDPARATGEIRADVSGCDYVAAQRRLINVEIPRLCREKTGRPVSLLSIRDESLGADRIMAMSFVVVE